MKIEEVHPNVMHAQGRRATGWHAEVFKKVLELHPVDQGGTWVLKVSDLGEIEAKSLQSCIFSAFGKKRMESNKFYCRCSVRKNGEGYLVFIEKLSSL